MHDGGDAHRGSRLRVKRPELGDNSGTAPEAGANRASGCVQQGGSFFGDRWWSVGATAAPCAAHGGHRAPGLPKGQGRGRKGDAGHGKAAPAAQYTWPWPRVAQQAPRGRGPIPFSWPSLQQFGMQTRSDRV